MNMGLSGCLQLPLGTSKFVLYENNGKGGVIFVSQFARLSKGRLKTLTV